ncbi:MAG: hypothetical protein HYZ59_04680 [Actinobacteria bacterium]|nr:hypothetical protein [Actinomycetota bacterium]
MRCEDLTELASAMADEEQTELLTLQAQEHLETCLRCQAEIAQYRKLIKALRVLRTEVLMPAPGFLNDVLTSLEEAGERGGLRLLLGGRKAAYAGGLAMATAAGAAGVIVLVGRSRQRRIGLAG